MSWTPEKRRIGSIPKQTALTILRRDGTAKPLGLRLGRLGLGRGGRNAIQRQPAYEEGERDWGKIVREEQVYKRPKQTISRKQIVIPERENGVKLGIENMGINNDGYLVLNIKLRGISINEVPPIKNDVPMGTIYDFQVTYPWVDIRGRERQTAHLGIATFGDVCAAWIAPTSEIDEHCFLYEEALPSQLLKTHNPRGMEVSITEDKDLIISYSKLSMTA